MIPNVFHEVDQQKPQLRVKLAMISECLFVWLVGSACYAPTGQMEWLSVSRRMSSVWKDSSVRKYSACIKSDLFFYFLALQAVATELQPEICGLCKILALLVGFSPLGDSMTFISHLGPARLMSY